jgi:uncharacterized protein YecE (DUF72 family)
MRPAFGAHSLASRGVAPDQFATYRALIERLLELVESHGLTAHDADRIRFAVRLRHDDWWSQIRDTAAENLGKRFVSAMIDADRDDLTTDQIGELEALIEEGLPRPD